MQTVSFWLRYSRLKHLRQRPNSVAESLDIDSMSIRAAELTR